AFFLAFYRRLALGDPVAAAVVAGRRALRDRSAQPDTGIGILDWAVPVHHARRDPRFTPAPWPSGTDDRGDDPEETLIGRDDAIHTVERAVGNRRVVLVHGPVGIGKTALAGEVATWWRRTGAVTTVVASDLRAAASTRPELPDPAA